jgi:hypothetical protein
MEATRPVLQALEDDCTAQTAEIDLGLKLSSVHGFYSSNIEHIGLT